MKKILLLSVMGLIVLTGCGSKKEEKKEIIIGSWKTSYELGAFGEVTERYIFKEKGECIRELITTSDIVNKCTYEIKEDEIRIIWEDKLDQESYTKYIAMDDKTIMIGNYKYIKE